MSQMPNRPQNKPLPKIPGPPNKPLPAKPLPRRPDAVPGVPAAPPMSGAMRQFNKVAKSAIAGAKANPPPAPAAPNPASTWKKGGAPAAGAAKPGGAQIGSQRAPLTKLMNSMKAAAAPGGAAGATAPGAAAGRPAPAAPPLARKASAGPSDRQVNALAKGLTKMPKKK